MNFISNNIECKQIMINMEIYTFKSIRGCWEFPNSAADNYWIWKAKMNKDLGLEFPASLY